VKEISFFQTKTDKFSQFSKIFRFLRLFLSPFMPKNVKKIKCTLYILSTFCAILRFDNISRLVHVPPAAPTPKIWGSRPPTPRIDAPVC